MTVQPIAAERHHSPFQLRVLLHHYYSPTNWNEVFHNEQGSMDAHDYWVDKGCLERTVDRRTLYIITARGRAMVDAWLGVPLPAKPKLGFALYKGTNDSPTEYGFTFELEGSVVSMFDLVLGHDAFPSEGMPDKAQACQWAAQAIVDAYNNRECQDE